MAIEETRREVRLARNETMFREVNEHIQEAASGFGDDGHVYRYLCECASRLCTDTVALTPSEYERVRVKPTRFLVIPGHELPEIERVVEERTGFVVVEKVGDAAAEAAED